MTKSYTRNFITMLSGNTLSQMIPFIVAPILSRVFTVEEFADFSSVLAIIGLIGIVATGRLELAIPLPKTKEAAQKIVFTGLMITIILSVLSILIPLFGNQINAFYKSENIANYLWLVPLSILSYGLLGLSSNWVLRMKNYSRLSIGKVSQSVINNGLAVLLGYFGAGVYGLILSWLISQYVNVFYLLYGYLNKIKIKNYNLETVVSTLKQYKDFPLVNSFHAFMDIFATQFILFWMISSFFGSTELGLFAIMVKYVKAPIVLVTSAVSQLFYVEASNAINENKSVKPIAFKTLKTTFLFAIPFVLVIIFFGPLIFKLYLGEKWEMAGVYARCLTPMFFISFLVSPISGIPILHNKQKRGFVFSFIWYFLILIALYVCIYFKLSFESSLWIYGLFFSLYYIFLLIWYYSLINKKR